MKKTMLMTLGLSLSLFTSAQTTKGSIIISASCGYSTTSNSTAVNLTQYTTKADSTPVPSTVSTTISLSTNPGYFIIDNLAIGLNFGYSNSVTPSTAEPYTTYYSWNNKYILLQTGPYIEKYITLNEKFYLTCSLNLNYSNAKSTSYYLWATSTSGNLIPYPTESSIGYGFSITPGLVFFPSTTWGISFKLNNILSYTITASKNAPDGFGATAMSVVTDNRTTHSFNIGIGLIPTIGISYVFVKQKAD